MTFEVHTRSAFVVINGIQLIQCRLPTESEKTCLVHKNAVENLRVVGDYGTFELTCLFYASRDVTGPDLPWIGELVVDDTNRIYLGQLPVSDMASPVVVTKLLQRYPRAFEFRVIYEKQEFYRHPEETNLVEEIQLLLLDQRLFPRGFMVPHTHIQSRVENLEIYKRVVMGHYKGKWIVFLSQQQDILALYPTAGEETRVGLREHIGQLVVEPQGSPQDEEKLLNTVREMLQAGDMTYVDLLRRLEGVPEFVNQLNPSHRILFRFLQSHTDIFWVKWDPVHTTRVGLVRQL